MSPHTGLCLTLALATVLVLAASGCGANEEIASADDDFTEASPEMDAVVARILPSGDYAGTHEGVPCTVSVTTTDTSATVTMYHDADVDEHGTVRGDFFKWNYNHGRRTRVHSFDVTGPDSFDSDVENKPEMALVASQRSKIWASTLGDPKVASVKIKEHGGLFGLTGPEMTCASLVPKQELKALP